MKRVHDVGGVLDHTHEASHADGRQARGFTASGTHTQTTQKSTNTASSRAMPAPAKASGPPISEDALASLKDVRDDKTATSWTLLSYEGGNIKGQLHRVASGTGGMAELASHLKNDIIAYGLVRVNDKVENIATVKFVFLAWVGHDVSPMAKALVATHKGCIADTFQVRTPLP